MLTALTRAVSSRINECELTFISRQAIDFNRALRQHLNYQQLLRSLGVEIVEIPPDDDSPDSCFIEDTALVLDRLAIITRPGSEARRRELEAVQAKLAEYRKIVRMEAPATLDGGDVLRIGASLFVGITRRTNHEAVEWLRPQVEPEGYKVFPVEVSGALHLKSVCTALDERTILADSSRVDLEPFQGYERLEVLPEEWRAANVLLVGGTVGMHSGFERTIAWLQQRGTKVRTVDISEFLKAEAGMTCMSLILDSAKTPA
jgi:dimethylargininase